MVTLSVLNREGREVEQIEFDPNEFGGAINKQLLHDAVVMYQANRRQGTVQTKGRGQVKGSGKKLYRQKGTGNARAGNRRTPSRRGGGMAFRKLPRDYSYRMPKKAVRAATRMALLSKFVDGEAVIIDQLSFPEPKTRAMAAILKAVNLHEQSCLIATAESDPNVYRSARNIRNVEISPAGDLNAYVLLRKKRLLLTRQAFDVLRERHRKPSKETGAASNGTPGAATSAAVSEAPEPPGHDAASNQERSEP